MSKHRQTSVFLMSAMKRAFYLGLYFLHSAVLPAQVNAYAKVTAVNNNVLSLSTINQVNGAFVAGQRVIVIQMQGASITTTANSQAYGVLNSLNSAGLYEIATIQSINSPVTSVTLTGALTNSTIHRAACRSCRFRNSAPTRTPLRPTSAVCPGMGKLAALWHFR